MTTPNTDRPPAYNLTDAFTIGKMRAFMGTLTPEQQLLFSQLGGGSPVHQPDFGELPPPAPPAPTTFFNPAASRVHKLDCYQHLRNIFLKEMSAAQAAHVAEELKPRLELFSSWDRMTTEYTQLLRAAYKEFHHGNKYYKGKGRQFWAWLKDHYPTAFALHFERAEGGRQDLDYDAAVPLYIMRPYIVEFLHSSLVLALRGLSLMRPCLALSRSALTFNVMG